MTLSQAQAAVKILLELNSVLISQVEQPSEDLEKLETTAEETVPTTQENTTVRYLCANTVYGGYKTSHGRCSGFQLRLVTGTDLASFGLAYWDLLSGDATGEFGPTSITTTNGIGVVEVYDVTDMGISGLADGDPNFWSSMQTTDFNRSSHTWFLGAPEACLEKPASFFRRIYGVGADILNELLPALITQDVSELNMSQTSFFNLISMIDLAYYGLSEEDRYGLKDLLDSVFKDPTPPAVDTQAQIESLLLPFEESKEDFIDENGVFNQERYNEEKRRFYEDYDAISLEDVLALHSLIWST